MNKFENAPTPSYAGHVRRHWIGREPETLNAGLWLGNENNENEKVSLKCLMKYFCRLIRKSGCISLMSHELPSPVESQY